MIHLAEARIDPPKPGTWRRPWRAVCPCGWTVRASDSADAFQQADDHNERLSRDVDTRPFDCTCLYLAGTDTVEAADTYPCEFCASKEETA